MQLGALWSDYPSFVSAYKCCDVHFIFYITVQDGSLIMARSEVNHCFYGRPVSPLEILSGSSVPPPRAAAPLYDALQQAMASLPDVQHVHVKHNKRQSGVYSPTPTT